jgi:hypothetical protein
MPPAYPGLASAERDDPGPQPGQFLDLSRRHQLPVGQMQRGVLGVDRVERRVSGVVYEGRAIRRPREVLWGDIGAQHGFCSEQRGHRQRLGPRKREVLPWVAEDG